MRVKELMELLSEFPKDMKVGFEHPSHDYWKSVLITEVRDAERGYAHYSEYHRQLAVPSDRELEEALEMQDMDKDFPDVKRVKEMLILR